MEEAPWSIGSRRVRRRLELGSQVDQAPSAGPSTSCQGGKGGRKAGGRPTKATAATGDAPRWCKAMYVSDAAKGDAPLRAVARTGREQDKNRIICRLCGGHISFAASSYTTASRHIMTHGVTKANLEVAVAFAAKAEEEGKPFPMKEWKAHLEAGDGKSKVYTYLQQVQHEMGTHAWKSHRDAIARYIAADTLPLATVESPAFRSLCKSLNGRCAAYSRKTISTKVSSLVLPMFKLFFKVCKTMRCKPIASTGVLRIVPACLQITELYNESVARIRDSNDWRRVRPAFTADLWTSRTTRQYFTLTMHWIDVKRSAAGSEWKLQWRILGAIPVVADHVDHAGEQSLRCGSSTPSGPLRRGAWRRASGVRRARCRWLLVLVLARFRQQVVGRLICPQCRAPRSHS